jgi:hypothetical protein
MFLSPPAIEEVVVIGRDIKSHQGSFLEKKINYHQVKCFAGRNQL